MGNTSVKTDRVYTTEELKSMGIVERDGKLIKAKAGRKSRIRFTQDGQANTKELILAAKARIEKDYSLLLQVLSGKASRAKIDYPLTLMSSERQAWLFNSLQMIHDATQAQLVAGRRTTTVNVVVPD